MGAGDSTGTTGALASAGATPMPTGQIAFLFTDVEGSTSRWEQSPASMERALAEHDRRLRRAIAAEHGVVFTTAGDSFAVAFARAAQAIRCAVEIQRALRDPCESESIRVRIGIHVGEATHRDDDYFGAVVNRAARVMSAAHGGQVVVTQATLDALPDGLPPLVATIDLGEHRLKDLLRPLRLHQLTHPDLDTEFAPLRTLAAPLTNLPVQFTSFVGREAEVVATTELLAEHRLVTLTGAGGAGKTRLALQLAAESADGFPDGVVLVELETATALEHVEDAVAAALRIRAVPDTPLLDTIVDGIGSRRILLVLDNCEQVLDATHHVVRGLLAGCGGIKIVVTSRERLGAAGEAHYPMPPLSLPGASGDALAEAGSVRLFVERARLVRPDFALTDDNGAAVATICRRLDGIPLAIELAAARVRVLSPAQIAERLDRRFDLLGTTDRGTLERHRTLAATIAWSYDQLEPREQAVFRRCGVFAGDFTVDAAEAVCADDTVDRFAVLDILGGLVDKSLVVPDGDGDHELRFRLLESMRDYGLSLGADDPEGVDAVRRRHLGHFVELAAALQARRRGGDLAGALDAFAADVENIRGALRFALDHGEVASAASIIGSIGYLWYASGAFPEGGRWCQELFAADPDLDDVVLADALHAYSLVLGSWAQPEAGAEMLRQQVEIRRRIGDPARLASALNNLGNILTDLGRFDEADACLREAVDAFAAAGEPATLPRVSLAFIARDRGDYDAAVGAATDALEEAGRSGDAYGLAVAQSALGEALLLRGDITAGVELIDSARLGFEELRVRPGVAYADLLLAVAAVRTGDRRVAADRLLGALADADGHWYVSAKYWALQLGAELLGQPDLAATWIGLAQQHYDQGDQRQPVWVIEHLRTVRDGITEALGADAADRRIAAGRAGSVARELDELRARLRPIRNGDERGSG